jgi:hypothetical protein
MKRALLLLACAATAGFMGGAQAQLFKCVGADGKTSYQSEPCPTAAKEQRMNLQKSSGAGASDSGEAMKPGWDERELLFMADVCAKTILIPARKEADAQMQPFPEAQLTPPVERYCTCIARRSATTWTFAEYSKDPVQLSSRLAVEALKGGPCKPEGLHAELLRKVGKMQ